MLTERTYKLVLSENEAEDLKSLLESFFKYQSDAGEGEQSSRAELANSIIAELGGPARSTKISVKKGKSAKISFGDIQANGGGGGGTDGEASARVITG